LGGEDGFALTFSSSCEFDPKNPSSQESESLFRDCFGPGISEALRSSLVGVPNVGSAIFARFDGKSALSTGTSSPDRFL
jgi:hypothetical protein